MCLLISGACDRFVYLGGQGVLTQGSVVVRAHNESVEVVARALL